MSGACNRIHRDVESQHSVEQGRLAIEMMLAKPAFRDLFATVLVCGGSADAQGITFGGGRNYPYPNEPQYQYPYADGRGRIVNPCPRGQAPYQGKCRKIRWLPGSPRL